MFLNVETVSRTVLRDFAGLENARGALVAELFLLLPGSFTVLGGSRCCAVLAGSKCYAEAEVR